MIVKISNSKEDLEDTIQEIPLEEKRIACLHTQTHKHTQKESVGSARLILSHILRKRKKTMERKK